MGALVYLLVLMFITLALLFYMLYVTKEASRLQIQEGFQPPTVPGGVGIMIVTFLLMVLYLPLSTMALHVVIWSEDLWVVPNPYINATSLPPALGPLGPPEEYRDPLDFCWTTTMKRNEINFAPAVVLCGLIVMATVRFASYGSPGCFAYASQFTIYFPIHLTRVIRFAVPKVDKYTEIGKLRSKSELNREYLRTLERDRNPFAFLYRSESSLTHGRWVIDFVLRLSPRVEWIFVGVHLSEAHNPSPDGTHRPRHVLVSISESQEDSGRPPNHSDDCHGFLLYTPMCNRPVLESDQ